MTQTAEKPIQLSYDALHQMFQQKFPTLVAPLEHAKAKLDRGEGASDLATIIKCEVACQEERTAFVYTWTGQTGQAFEYRVLKAFDPTPTRKPKAAQEAPEAPEETLVKSSASLLLRLLKRVMSLQGLRQPRQRKYCRWKTRSSQSPSLNAPFLPLAFSPPLRSLSGRTP